MNRKTSTQHWVLTAVLSLSFWLANPAKAEDNLAFSSYIATSVGQFHGATDKKTIDSQHIQLQLTYLDYLEIAFYSKLSEINYDAEFQPLEQNDYAITTRYTQFFDRLSGRVKWGLGLHAIDNNDVSQVSDDVYVYSPSISYSPWDEHYEFQLGVSISHYASLGTQKQWRFRGGYLFNRKRDWIATQLFYSEPVFNSQEKHQSAYTLLWQHWFEPNNSLGIDYFRVSATDGERQFATDPNYYLVNNSNDVELQRYSLGLNWSLSYNSNILLVASYGELRDPDTLDHYYDPSLYIHIGKKW